MTASLQVTIAVGASSADLSITLALPTGPLTFSQSQATDLGDYVGPFVHQRCYAQKSGPWLVFFRPDADGSRQEVVVEYGTLYRFTTAGVAPITDSDLVPAHLPGYTATIMSGTAILARITVPMHYWGARWRWFSSPRPGVRTLADLVAVKALPPMSATAMWGKVPTLVSIPYAGPMTTGGLMTAMGATGDRPDIGHITEYQAAHLVAGNPNATTTMRAQAEAAGTMCLHIRDSRTWAAYDVHQFPYLRLWLGSGPQIPIASRLSNDPHYFMLDVAHFPDVAFIPWLLTDDPYLLEECQFVANYHSIESGYHQNAQKLPGMVQPSQTRGWAWGVRDVGRMAGFAPTTPPGWLLPRSVWARHLADCLTFAKKYLASMTPSCHIFSLITQTNWLSSWMIGYHASVVGWMKWSRLFPEWDAAASFILKVILELNSPASAGGWDRRWPAPYQVNILNFRVIAPGGGGQVSDPQYNPSSYDVNTPISWGEAWALYQTWCNAQPHTRPFDPASWTEDRVYQNAVDAPYGTNIAHPSGPHYVEIQRGALALCALAGEPNAAAAHDWLAPQMRGIMASYAYMPAYRYAFWPG